MVAKSKIITWAHEKPFLLLVVGYPADGAVVPDIGKKPLSEIATFI